jgi:hypothetical protein
MPRHAILQVSSDFFVSMCKPHNDDMGFAIQVGNPLPNDAQMVDFYVLYDNVVGIVVESDEFEDVPEGQELPRLDPVYFSRTWLEVY